MRPPGHRGESAASLRPRVIIRRGASERFQILQGTVAGDPVDLTWDRRAGARRHHPHPVTAERCRSDRLGLPPATWTALDFVVVHLPHRQEHLEDGLA